MRRQITGDALISRRGALRLAGLAVVSLAAGGCDTTEVERYFRPPISATHEMRNTADLDNVMRCRMGYPMPDRSWEREGASERHPYERDMCGVTETSAPASAPLPAQRRPTGRPVIDNGK
ncbi:MAG: twin-arginine translocation signal domain-containing protein [Phreatobacter sp.]|jgi:hypothetical protein|nr:twin-arginine translocation signal domain-containing protein [Phreatobacter sp.]